MLSFLVTFSCRMLDNLFKRLFRVCQLKSNSIQFSHEISHTDLEALQQRGGESHSAKLTYPLASPFTLLDLNQLHFISYASHSPLPRATFDSSSVASKKLLSFSGVFHNVCTLPSTRFISLPFDGVKVYFDFGAENIHSHTSVH